jgi:CUE domain
MSADTASPPLAQSSSSISKPPRGTGPPRYGSSSQRGQRGARAGPPRHKPESADWASAQDDLAPDSSTTEEMTVLKIKYASQLKTLRDVFPDWTAEDLVYTLQEVDGDLDLATDRIAGGTFTSLPYARVWELTV